MSERYELYYDPDTVLDVPENAGLPDEGVEPVLRRIRELGATYEVVDVSAFSREELEDAYVKSGRATLGASPVRHKAGVRHEQVCWVALRPGVPALVVVEDGRPVDVYPHEEEGRIVTINDFVKRLGGAGAATSGTALAARMDAVRAKFTGVGMTATELVKEGRRR